MMKKIEILLFLLVVNVISARATFYLGLSGSVSRNYYEKESGYAYDRRYYPKLGGGIGVSSRYYFYDWFGLRLDLQFLQRNYSLSVKVFDESYKYSQWYSIVPLMVSFSFGSKAVRGYFDAGGYIGFWLCGAYTYKLKAFDNDDEFVQGTVKYDFDVQKDNRFDAGLSGVLGVIYLHEKTGIFVNMEVFSHYGLVNSNKPTSQYFKQPAYHTTIGITVGLGYKFRVRHAKRDDTITNQQI